MTSGINQNLIFEMASSVRQQSIMVALVIVKVTRWFVMNYPAAELRGIKMNLKLIYPDAEHRGILLIKEVSY